MEPRETPQRVISGGVVTARYVRLGGRLSWVAEVVTGLTTKAMQQKIDSDVWRQNEVWRKGPDGNRYLDIIGYENWIERGEPLG